MLVLTRKRNEGLVFDDGRVRIRILDVAGKRVKLGVEASQDVHIVRDELVGQRQDPISMRWLVSDISTTDELKRAFLAWLADFEAIDDAEELLRWVASCSDPLPSDCIRSLDLAGGSSYADAAAIFSSEWETGVDPHYSH